MPKICVTALILLAVFTAKVTLSEEDTPVSAADKQALSAMQPLIGSWRGVGQPQRGSNKGAWIEEADWAWRFADAQASVRLTSPQSKYLVSGVVQAGDKEGQLRLSATLANAAEPSTYQGSFQDDGSLVFVDPSPPDGYPARVSIRLVAEDKRMLITYERRNSSDRYFRIAEVGLTRKGSGFGSGTPLVECVVTGGRGTIPVTYQGRTYYVCCSGCRDHFNDDPASVLAEYRERKDGEKKP